MTVLRVTKILGDIPVRRVEGGDGWIARANAEIGEEKFKRSMTGEEITVVYNNLTVEQRTLADAAFELADVDITELVEEVFRIREDQTEEEKVSRNDSALQTFGFVVSLVLCSLGAVAVALVIVSTIGSHEVPTGYMLTMFKMLIRYLTHQDLEIP